MIHIAGDNAPHPNKMLSHFDRLATAQPVETEHPCAIQCNVANGDNITNCMERLRNHVSCSDKSGLCSVNTGKNGRLLRGFPLKIGFWSPRPNTDTF